MIASTVVYFRWQPPVTGHRWALARPVTDLWSVAREKAQVLCPRNGFPMFWKYYGKEESIYEPLEVASGLFRELAAIDPSTEGILPFADRYGPLTPGRLFVPEGNRESFPKPPRPSSPSYEPVRPINSGDVNQQEWSGHWVLRGAVMGDSLEDWQGNIRDLKALVGLWDAFGRKDRRLIENVVQFDWDGKKRLVRLIDEGGRELDDPVLWDQPSSVSLTLQKAAQHALLRALTSRTTNGSSISLHRAESPHHTKLAIVPRSLRDAIWLQFALAVIGHKKYGACDVCGKPYEISPQVARTNRTLCSAACKARAHRQRRDRALKLDSEGRTPKQIAKQVGSQLSTVQKWLTEAKEK